MQSTENNSELFIRSKDNVINYGEVLTPKRIVNEMLDLVKNETERIDSTFLEPACGNGNFLAEILTRKFEIVEQRYKKKQFDFEIYSVIAISSIYGIEIQQDNVAACRERLLGIFTMHMEKNFKSIKSELVKTAEFIISRNIIWGDALSLKTPDEKKEPIVFSQWGLIHGFKMSRKDYTLDKLLNPREAEIGSLFDEMGEETFLPTPIKEFSSVNIFELGEYYAS